jgi:hypothetical protein
MKLEYIGKEPMSMVGGITGVILKKGDQVDVPDLRAKKWLADQQMSKLFKAVNEKGKDKEATK